LLVIPGKIVFATSFASMPEAQSYCDRISTTEIRRTRKFLEMSFVLHCST
jgi:hypothetical protein